MSGQMGQQITEFEAETLFGTGTKSQALQLLSRGLGITKVAELLDVSPSLISQYKEDPSFLRELEKLTQERNLAAAMRDERLDQLEDQAIEAVSHHLHNIFKPMDAVKALSMINGLKRRGQGEGRPEDLDKRAGVVILDLPPNATRVDANINVDYTPQREIVQVEGTAMRTMNSSSVMKKLEERKEARAKIENSEEILENSEQDFQESHLEGLTIKEKINIMDSESLE